MHSSDKGSGLGGPDSPLRPKGVPARLLLLAGVVIACALAVASWKGCGAEAVEAPPAEASAGNDQGDAGPIQADRNARLKVSFAPGVLDLQGREIEVIVKLRSGLVVSARSSSGRSVDLPANDYGGAEVAAVDRSKPRPGLSEAAAGFASLTLPMAAPAECVLAPVALFSLDVLVRHADQSPAVGAQVMLQFDSEAEADTWAAFHRANGDLGPQQTDDEGRAAVRLIPAGTAVRVIAVLGDAAASFGPVLVASQMQVELKLAAPAMALEVELQTRDGRPVVGVDLWYSVYAKADGEEQLRSGIATTSGNGVAIIPRFNGEFVLLAGVREPDRYAEESTRLVRPAETRVVLRVGPAVQWQVRVVYSDGEPYAGSLTISNRHFSLNVSSHLVDAKGLPREGGVPGQFSAKGVAADVANEVRVYPQRAGYAQHVFHVAESESARTFHAFVIPPATGASATGALRFDTSNRRVDARVRIINPRSGAVSSSFPLTEPVSRVVAVGTYIVQVTGKDVSWQGPPVVVLSGQEAVIQLEFAPTCTLRARVVSTTGGEPLPGAVLEAATATVPVFPERPEEYSLAVSDTAGAVALAGQPPGERDYRIEAEGFMPQTVRCQVPRGGAFDLGTIKLVPATGSISVALERDQPLPAEAMTIDLMQPHGRRMRSQLPRFSTGGHKFERLVPGRTYIVVICDEHGSSLKVINDVVVTEEKPHKEVRILVSELGRD